ncbi:hypothetical protein [Caulobacter sp. D4A]|uniref:hypothetical protein n=1 Tax=Caulobacter sp. D4A TaxID=2204171 RepID=UPI0011B3B30D|nr:hypothetical protein [Caulobacter sp. D4A]
MIQPATSDAFRFSLIIKEISGFLASGDGKKSIFVGEKSASAAETGAHRLVRNDVCRDGKARAATEKKVSEVPL